MTAPADKTRAPYTIVPAGEKREVQKWREAAARLRDARGRLEISIAIEKLIRLLPDETGSKRAVARECATER